MTAKEIAEKINELFQMAEKEDIIIVLDCEAEMGAQLSEARVCLDWYGENAIAIW